MMNIAQFYNEYEKGDLLKVTTIALPDCGLFEIPKEIFHLTHIKHLNLRRNNITLIPDNIGELTNLEELDLSENMIRVVSREIIKLEKLKRLNLGYNNIGLDDQSKYILKLNLPIKLNYRSCSDGIFLQGNPICNNIRGE